MAAKNRDRLGYLSAPVQAKKVFFRPLNNFDHAETLNHPQTGAWIVVLADESIMRANTYSGNLGRNYTPQTAPKPDEKQWKKWTRDYDEVPVANCPFAVAVAAAETPKVEPPVGEEPKSEEPTESKTGDELVDELIEGETPQA